MTDKLISEIYADATNYKDIDSFVSDWVTSSVFGDPDDLILEVDQILIRQLTTLWHVANDSFRDLLDLMGFNITQCSTRFCIPYRTVQDWAAGRRTPPSYVRLMMAEIVGLICKEDRQ